MALFRKARAVDELQARMDRLEALPDVAQAEDRIGWWLGTDEGWAELTETFLVGAPADVLNEQVRMSTAEFTARYESFVATSERLQVITDGLKHAGLHGWVVAVVRPVLDGWRPDGRALDPAALADVANAEAGRLEPLSDQEWFGVHNRDGITMYQNCLRPLQVSSDAVGTEPGPTELMKVGRFLLNYGVALGRAQVRLQR